MNNKDWKEYRRLADNGEHPEVKTRDVLDLLDERDALHKLAKEVIRTSRGEDLEREFWNAIKKLKAAIQLAS